MWQVLIFWEGGWEQIGLPYATRTEAEWACGVWRQSWQCMRDCFKVQEYRGLLRLHEEPAEPTAEEALEVQEEVDSGQS